MGSPSNPDCKEDGKAFSYWTDEAGNKISALYNYVFSKDETLKAVYEDAYTITAHANGGIFTDLDDSVEDKSVRVYKVSKGNYLYISSYYLYKDGMISDSDSNSQILPTSIKFGGWYDETFTTLLAKPNYSLTPTGDMDIYARWIGRKNVTFNLGDGKTAGGESTVSYYVWEDEKIGDYTIPSNIVTPEGKAFDGWYKDAEFKEPVSFKELKSWVVTSDATFYAKYAESFTVTFDANGGTFVSTNDKTVSINIVKGTTLKGKYPNIKSAKDKVFKGWFTEPECKNEITDIANYKVEGDVTFYAGYTEDCYVLTFHANHKGAWLEDDKDTVEVYVTKGTAFRFGSEDEDKDALFKAPNLYISDEADAIPYTMVSNYYENYTHFEILSGWATVEKAASSDKLYYFGTKEHYYISDGKKTNLNFYGFVPTSNMHFYAQWADKSTETVNVTFNANGGFFNSYYDRYNEDKLDELFGVRSDDGTERTVTVPKGILFGNVTKPYGGIVNPPDSTSGLSWGYREKECTNYISADTVIDEDITVFVKWYPYSGGSGSQDYKEITFHSGKGYIGTDKANKTSSFTVRPGATTRTSTPIPNIDDPGLSFDGWYTDPECQNRYTAGKQYFEHGMWYIFVPEEISDLYAGYSASRTVTLDANGGYFEDSADFSKNPDEIIKEENIKDVKENISGYGIKISDYTSKVRRDGNKIFAGWFYDAAGNNKVETVAYEYGSEYFIPESTTTIYAKWIDYEPVETVKAVKAYYTIKLGEKIKLEATVEPDSAARTQKVQWFIDSVTYSSQYNAGYTAPIELTSDGYVTGRGEGWAYVYAEANGVRSETVTVYVEHGTAPEPEPEPTQLIANPVIFMDEYGGRLLDDEGKLVLQNPVYNGFKVRLTNEGRGAKIKYAVDYASAADSYVFPDYASDEDFLAKALDYLDDIVISTKENDAKVRITAIAQEENKEDSPRTEIIISIDNSQLLEREYGIAPEDLDLFDIETVAASGLVVSRLPEPMYYTGQSITFEDWSVRVYFNGRRLSSGTDYKLSYGNNINAYTGNLNDKKAPYVKITLSGNYSGSETIPFAIEPIPIQWAYNTAGNVFTVSSSDKKIEPSLAVKYEGWIKTLSLKKGTDYEMFYNRITYGQDDEQIIDFTHELTIDQVASEIKANPDIRRQYLINVRGKGNYDGVLGEMIGDYAERSWAPFLDVVPSKEIADYGLLLLKNAKLSSKIPAQQYSETKGKDIDENTVYTPDVKSKDVIKLFTEGKKPIKVTIGKTALTYVPEDKANTITEDGYYFTIDDPADYDDYTNRYVSANNFITLRPTNVDGLVKGDGTPVANKLEGILDVYFEIKGQKISVKDVTSTIAFDGKDVLSYNDDGETNISETLTRLYKATKKAPTGKVKVQAGGADLDESQFFIYTLGDRNELGTVTVVFEGNIDRGITGTVTKKVKITARKLTKNDVKVVYEETGKEAPITVPYSKSGAKPEVKVYLTSNGEELDPWRGDYTVSYTSNTTVGKSGYVNLKFGGNYTGSASKANTFTVGKAEFDHHNISADATDKVYKAKAKKNYFKVVPTLYDGEKALKLKSDYVYVDEPEYRYGADYIEKDAKGEVTYARYAGTIIPDDEIVHAGAVIEVQFSAKPKDGSKVYDAPKNADGKVWFAATYRMGEVNISGCKITVAKQYYNSGKPVYPSKKDITITKSGYNFGTDDFEIISVTNNYKVGTATMIIQGNGQLCGTKKVNFKIQKVKK
jgi:hypothetical protein